jgi:hypothetical protein
LKKKVGKKKRGSVDKKSFEGRLKMIEKEREKKEKKERERAI